MHSAPFAIDRQRDVVVAELMRELYRQRSSVHTTRKTWYTRIAKAAAMDLLKIVKRPLLWISLLHHLCHLSQMFISSTTVRAVSKGPRLLLLRKPNAVRPPWGWWPFSPRNDLIFTGSRASPNCFQAGHLDWCESTSHLKKASSLLISFLAFSTVALRRNSCRVQMHFCQHG